MSILAIGFGASLLVALLLVLSQNWHGHFSMDGIAGVQKHHEHPTPRIGGVAVVLGLLAVWAFAAANVQAILGPMLLASLPAFAAGLLEDVTKKVGVVPRLLATMISGAVAWYLTGSPCAIQVWVRWIGCWHLHPLQCCLQRLPWGCGQCGEYHRRF